MVFGAYDIYPEFYISQRKEFGDFKNEISDWSDHTEVHLTYIARGKYG